MRAWRVGIGLVAILGCQAPSEGPGRVAQLELENAELVRRIEDQSASLAELEAALTRAEADIKTLEELAMSLSAHLSELGKLIFEPSCRPPD
jgi:septal ring factor EnvC (AmiA/AmiB activator)